MSNDWNVEAVEGYTNRLIDVKNMRKISGASTAAAAGQSRCDCSKLLVPPYYVVELVRPLQRA